VGREDDGAEKVGTDEDADGMGMLEGTEGIEVLDEGAGTTEEADGTDEGVDQLRVEDGSGMYDDDTGTEGMEDQLLGATEAEEEAGLHWRL
jgi:hypothetical protein